MPPVQTRGETELWALSRKMWSRGHVPLSPGECVPGGGGPLVPPPWRSAHQEAGGGHILWSELQRHSGQLCIGGETEAQKGQRLARGHLSG